MCKLIPDLHLPVCTALSAQELTRRGIRALMLDLDNTLAPYEQPEPDEALCQWVETMKAAGIRCAIVSNNHSERVARFARCLSLPAYTDAAKPFPRAFRRAMREMGVSPAETAAIGDQIYTDLLAARLAHVGFVVTVLPIRDRRDLLTRFKRLCERPVMRAYRRRQNKIEKEDKQS